MMLFFIGTVAGLLAFLLGWWRASCGFWELHAPYNLPSLWYSPAVRIGTWFISAVLSMIFAAAFALLISSAMGETIGKFSFGGLLAIRWMISGMAAASGAEPVLRRIRMQQEKGELERERDTNGIKFRQRDDADAAAMGTLHEAAKCGDLDGVTRLLEKHPDAISMTNHEGWSALNVVAAQGEDIAERHIAVAQKLLEFGADPNSRTPLGWTPILLIAINGSAESVPLAELLLKNGADIHATAKDGISNWRLLWQHGNEIRKLLSDYELQTPKPSSDTQPKI